MARFNTTQSTISITGATTLTYVIDKSTILLTGSSGYTLTLASPILFPGTSQTIYNATGGNVTIVSAVNNLVGNGFTSATSQIIPNNTTYTVTSNSTDYVITNNQGGPIAVTSATFSGAVTLSPANANISVSPTGTGTVTVNPATVGSINNMTVGATTRASGAFTTLDANSTVGLSGTNAAITISPTGTGTVTIAPATAGNINNMNLGATTRGSGAFTTLAANSTATFTGAITADTGANNQSHTTTGAATITITSGGVGSINNMNIGATTAGTGRFTTVTATTSATLQAGTVATTPSASTDIANKSYVDAGDTKVSASGFYYGTM